MISRMRVIALVGAGAISSAAICSLYLAYTLERSTTGEIPVDGFAAIGSAEDEAEGEEISVQEPRPEERPREGQSFLVAFLANADPQVRTLAAWGLASGEETKERQRDILDFVRKEQDPEVRTALYRFLHGQKSLNCSTLVEIVKQEEDHQTWLAGCDLLAGAVQNGASSETLDFFHVTVVPKLRQSALNGVDLHAKIAAIIALRRAGTNEAIDALQEVIEASGDEQVVQAASSAVRLTVAVDR